MQSSGDFHARVRTAVADSNLRVSFRKAMDGFMSKRLDAFPDAEALERLRLRGAEIRVNALSKLPELLERLERQCQAN
ncbi:MAG: (Fe-S)-binding protein, partial [Candidatus Thiodiazotropha sp. 6PLUC10]